jgi:hypothetical protein
VVVVPVVVAPSLASAATSALSPAQFANVTVHAPPPVNDSRATSTAVVAVVDLSVTGSASPAFSGVSAKAAVAPGASSSGCAPNAVKSGVVHWFVTLA